MFLAAGREPAGIADNSKHRRARALTLKIPLRRCRQGRSFTVGTTVLLLVTFFAVKHDRCGAGCAISVSPTLPPCALAGFFRLLRFLPTSPTQAAVDDDPSTESTSRS
jgi:hypothetical protein